MFKDLPTTGLVVLVGTPASGKSTFSTLAFARGDVLSTDDMRALVGGTASNMSAADAAAALLAEVADQRLRQGILTVVDSTGTQDGLLDRLDHSARAANAEVHYVDFPTPVVECLRRNRRRTMHQRIPDEAVESIAAKVETLVAALAADGRCVKPVESFLAHRLHGRSAFLAMPVTEFLSNGGFRADKRRFFELVHAALGLTGLAVKSAAVNEDYGTIVMEAPDYTRYDIDELLAADCLLIGTTSAMSPDIYLEIGTAIGAGKPVGLVHPQRGGMTGMMRGLVQLGVVRRQEFVRDDQLPVMVATMAMSLLAGAE